MAGNLGTLTLDLVAKIGGFTGPLDKAGRHTKKTSNQMAKDLQALGKAAAVAFVAVASAVAVFVKKTIDAADNARKTAQGIGLTTEAFQGLTFAAKIGGVEQEVFAKAIGKLNKAMFDAANGLKTYRDAFYALGLEFKNADGSLRPTEEVLYDLADIMEKTATGSEKTGVAMSLLGTRIGGALIPFLNQGRDGIQKLVKQAETLGYVMSDEAAQGAERFNDSITVLSAAVQGFWNKVTASLLPTLNNVTDELISLTENGQEASVVAADLAESIKWLANFALGAVAGFHILGKEIGGLAAVSEAAFKGMTWKDHLTPFGGLLALKRNAADIKQMKNIVDEDISGTIESYIKLFDKLNTAQDGEGLDAVNERIREQAALLKQLQEANKADAIDKRIKALELEAATYGMTARETELYKLQQEGATDEQLRSVDALLAQIEALDAAKGYWNTFLTSLKNNMGNMDSIVGDMLSRWTSDFGDFAATAILDSSSIEDAVVAMADGMKRAVLSALFEMIAQWMVYRAVASFFPGSAPTTSAPAAAAVPAAPAAPTATPFVGMADEGMHTIPTSGSWLLQKGERVLTSRTSRRLDDTLARINGQMGGTIVNVYAPAGSDVQQERSQENGMEKIDIYIDQAVSGKIGDPGSRTHKSLRNTFGLGQQLTKR